MREPVIIPTEQPGVTLRELWTEDDDIAFIDSVNANREHLSQHDGHTPKLFPNKEAVTQKRELWGKSQLRLGIWKPATFLGHIGLIPDLYHGADIYYWLDARHTGNGYATAAARALATYSIQQMNYSVIKAYVAEENLASMAVLERAGFDRLPPDIDRTAFEFTKANIP